ncbi:hypothetical protein LQ51_17810 [Micromonospora sp. HK10]|nr:hypothetical protein LQ51_17810 [Micromonospora sp. HK10]
MPLPARAATGLLPLSARAATGLLALPARAATGLPPVALTHAATVVEPGRPGAQAGGPGKFFGILGN